MLMISRSRAGIDRAHHVLDVGVLEAADHVHDGVHLADVGEELVAEAFALAGALHQAGDVHELHRGRHRPLRRDDAGEHVEPRVGHLHDAGVGLDGGEGIVRHQRPAEVSALKRVDLPTLGRPTIPSRSMVS